MKKIALIIENNNKFNNIWSEYFKNELNIDVKVINNLKSNLILQKDRISFIIFNSSKEQFLDIQYKLESFNKPVLVLIDSFWEKILKEKLYYFNKPLNLNLFKKNIKEILSNKKNYNIKTFSIGNYTININKKQLLNTKNQVMIRFTDKEILIFYEILKSKQLGINKTDLLNKVWNYNERVETKTVETSIYRLRKKLSKIFKNKDVILNIEKKYKIII
tara:strand:+ start:924 stop:1577 length:654 start_codon:yes stop_codon:yes gene_type:complete